MARQLRIDYPGAWHHVMNRGRRKETIFRDAEDRWDFLRLLGVAHARYGLEVHAYALMGTHYHLVVRSPTGELSKAIQYVDGVFAQRFNRRHGVDGPLFRGRFTAKLVDSDSYLDTVVRYVHRNPLALVEPQNLHKYEWSSYFDFHLAAESQPSWLYSGALAMAGVETVEQLRRWTLSESLTPFDPSMFPQVIGDRPFVNAVLARSTVDDQTIGHLRAGVARPTPEEICKEVRRVFGDSGDQRLVSLGLCQELGGLSLRELAQRFGYSTPQSAGSAADRFRKRSVEEEWALAVEKVRKGLEGSAVDPRCR